MIGIMTEYITTQKQFLELWQSLKDKVPVRVMYTEVRCKFCDSRNAIRYGILKGMQRWWCKECHRKFVDNGATAYMKTHADQVAAALGMYYGGISMDNIRRQLRLHYHTYPSDSTVFRWIRKYTNEATENTERDTPNVGDVWLADETSLSMADKNVWLWDVIDARTRYLLASYITTDRTTEDAQTIMERAAQKAGKVPRMVLTDNLAAYLHGIQVTLAADTKHVAVINLAAKQNNKLIECFHHALKQRIKIMQALKNYENAELILNGFVIHYNYFKLQEGLQNRTPSELAGIDKCLDRNWFIAVKRCREFIETWRKGYKLMLSQPHIGTMQNSRYVISKCY